MNLDRLSKNDKSPKYYKHYPLLFKEYFDQVNPDKINELSRAGYIYYHSILLTDSLIDDKKFSSFPMITFLQEESIKLLTSVFGKDSRFWIYWNKRRQEYFDAVKIEKKLNYDKIVSFSSYADLADKKSAFGKIAIDSLFLLANEEDRKLYRTLLKSHYYFSVGFQLYDDVKDFREDYERDQFNWAIYEQKKCPNYENNVGDVKILNKLLFINGVGQKVLSRSIAYFQKAIDELKNCVANSGWKNIIFETKRTIENYLDITHGYIQTLEKRLELRKRACIDNSFFEFQSINNIVVKKGLTFLKDEYQHNYSDLKHIMYLSKNDGFESNENIHVSDVFQRAMLNDCIVDVSLKNNLDSASFLDQECRYLIDRRNKDTVGGWSYFPSVGEIAADIDDLGQIMQLFMRTGNRNHITSYCLPAIYLALSEKRFANGAIETWIVPNHNRTPMQEKQENFNETKWGKGPDVEVVANFIYALHMFDAELYKEYCQDSVQFILNNQKKPGFWISRWYYGIYYGTYLCLRILKEYQELGKSNIDRALECLLERQNDDGGFSLAEDSSSDSLSTSLCILSLRLFFDSNHKSIRDAINFLKSAQNSGGYWEEVNFIRPKANEPYKSKTITTAIALKALSQCDVC